MLTRNEGGLDRVFRIALGLVLIVSGYVAGGTWGVILYVIALVPLLTGVIGWCPIYSLFHIDTCGLKKS